MAKKVIVIQCAGTKNPNAGFWKHGDKEVKFVAQPELCHDSAEAIYRKPDDIIPGTTIMWRQKLQEYNQEYKQTGNNPHGLFEAWKLYKPSIYEELKEWGRENFFILSAGWGLVKSDYLLPKYDITFGNVKGKDAYKKRRREDEWNDFNQLIEEKIEWSDTIYFFGGKNYVECYLKLTKNLLGKTVIYYWGNKPVVTDERHQYKTRECPIKETYDNRKIHNRNWYYLCAKAFVKGDLEE